MSWAKFDDVTPADAKIAALSDKAFRAWFDGICHAAEKLTDGFIPARIAKQLAGNSRVMKELVPASWHVAPDICKDCQEWPEAIAAAQSGDGYYIHVYLRYNPTRAEVEAERDKRQEGKVRAGKAGAAARWGKQGKKSRESDSRTIADGIAEPPKNSLLLMANV